MTFNLLWNFVLHIWKENGEKIHDIAGNGWVDDIQLFNIHERS